VILDMWATCAFLCFDLLVSAYVFSLFKFSSRSRSYFSSILHYCIKFRYTSASPYDPTFWLIHGTTDRLMHWRRLFAKTASSGSPSSSSSLLVGSSAAAMPFDETWGYAHSTVAPSDTNLVCDWSGVDATDFSSTSFSDSLSSSSSLGMPTCVTGTCPGHGADDLLPFEGFATGDEAGVFFTNRQMYDFLSPFSEDLPYVYDNFAWEHCDKEGYTFGAQEAITKPTTTATAAATTTTTAQQKAEGAGLSRSSRSSR
jgi:hypothetical protein